MKFFFVILAALSLVAVHHCGCWRHQEQKRALPKIHRVPLPSKFGDEKQVFDPAHHHWQLGAIIGNHTSTCHDCDVIEVGMEVFNGTDDATTGKMVFSETVLTVDPVENEVTAWIQPAKLPVVTMQGCLETIFIGDTDAGAVKRKFHNEVKQHMLVIFMADDLSKLDDDSIFRIMALRNVSVGFFADANVPTGMKDRLVHYGTPFFENLVRPHAEITGDWFVDQPDKVYYAFKFVFAPTTDETSLPASLKMKPPRKINLADLVIFSSQVKEIQQRCLKKTEVVLSHKFGPSTHVPIVPYVQRPEIFEGKRLSFFDHYGTHIDAPYHFDADKNDITTLPTVLHKAMNCVKVNVPYNGVANFSIKPEHLIEWEKQFGPIPTNSMVLLVTGFGTANWHQVEAYQRGYPGLSVEAARFLVEQRKTVAIGIDSLLIDDYSLEMELSYPTHVYLAETDAVAIENINGDELAHFPSKGGICLLSYLRVEKGSGGPVAVFGLKPNRLNGPSLYL